jgi:hypothetical protein
LIIRKIQASHYHQPVVELPESTARPGTRVVSDKEFMAIHSSENNLDETS